MGDLLLKFLLLVYVLAAAAYACDGNVSKSLYFGGSAILSLGVLWMK